MTRIQLGKGTGAVALWEEGQMIIIMIMITIIIIIITTTTTMIIHNDDVDDDNANDSNNNNNNDDDNDSERLHSLFFIISLCRELSTIHTLKSQPCANYVQHIGRLSRATCVPCGT